jgi:hypothetical protein
MILAWSDMAFAARAPLARVGQVAVLRPQIAAVIRAAYAPVLPGMSQDASHAYRLAARAALLMQDPQTPLREQG